ncbi:hypothetical protein [Candidatus Albibeggiatoa sp. nov. BB20]|uniref:hypothetical protein n=1 Tax=Candidatus Albibeggiatoa sp. nov. BB20 TaxID=3162723 RepID=UPI0033658A9F
MSTVSDLSLVIDEKNQTFIDKNKAELADLSKYSTEALEWLMMEHYQFSFQNVEFLADSAQVSGGFDTNTVKEELIRNHGEENGHAAIYKDALKRVNCDIEERVEFPATSQFLEKIGQLSNTTPSTVLGTMFATETAAIFEHEVFLDVSKEVIKRGEWGQKGDRLVGFHEMHLSGVEQSHRDELGIFLKGVPVDQEIITKEGDRPTIHVTQALEGAEQAIEAMVTWWDTMINKAKTMSQAATA